MKQYIDKSALVTEIEKRIEEGEKVVEELPSSAILGLIQAYKNTLSLIDTLEVKEVDLENAVKGRINYPLIGADFPNIYPNYRELKDYCDKNGIKDEDKVKIIITKTL